MPDNFKLSIDLVPRPLWGLSLNKLLKRSEWDKIRKVVYAEHGQQCAICGAAGRLYCHEVWRDDNHMQTLTDFTALCGSCNGVTHFGLSRNLARQGRLDIRAVVRHVLEVNGCTLDEFREGVLPLTRGGG